MLYEKPRAEGCRSAQPNWTRKKRRKRRAASQYILPAETVDELRRPNVPARRRGTTTASRFSSNRLRKGFNPTSPRTLSRPTDLVRGARRVLQTPSTQPSSPSTAWRRSRPSGTPIWPSAACRCRTRRIPDDVVQAAALEMRAFIAERWRSVGPLPWHAHRRAIPAPVNRGPSSGRGNSNNDVWGDTVNIAARMESSGAVGQGKHLPGHARLPRARAFEFVFRAGEHRGEGKGEARHVLRRSSEILRSRAPRGGTKNRRNRANIRDP